MPKIDRETKALDTANAVRQTEGSAVVTSTRRGSSVRGQPTQDTYEPPPSRAKKEVTSLEQFNEAFSKVDLVDIMRDLDFDAGVRKFERKFEDETEEKTRERRLMEQRKKDIARTSMPRARVPVISLSPLHHVVVPQSGQGGPNLPSPNLPTTSPIMFPMWSGESIDALQARASAYEGMIRDQASAAQGYGKTVEDISREERKRMLRLEELRLQDKRARGEDWVDDAGDHRRDYESTMDKNAEAIREQEQLHEQLLEEQRTRQEMDAQATNARLMEEQMERDRLDRQRQAEILAAEQRERDRKRYDD